MASRNKVALVGAGRMGSAMAAGWLGAKDNALPPEDLILVCPRVSDSARPLVDRYGLKVVETLDAKTAAEVGRVVVAVKPQVFPKIAPALSEAVREDALIISVLAGTGLKALGRVFPGRPVIRVMPNTPGSIGKGINVAVANEIGDTPENRKAAEDLAIVTGPVEWLDEERLMDAATGEDYRGLPAGGLRVHQRHQQPGGRGSLEHFPGHRGRPGWTVTPAAAPVPPGQLTLTHATSQAIVAGGGLGTPSPDARGVDAWGVLLVLASALPLVARRRAPLTVYAVTTAATLVLLGLAYPADVPAGHQGPQRLALIQKLN
jgi:hypothetical protein